MEINDNCSQDNSQLGEVEFNQLLYPTGLHMQTYLHVYVCSQTFLHASVGPHFFSHEIISFFSVREKHVRHAGEHFRTVNVSCLMFLVVVRSNGNRAEESSLPVVPVKSVCHLSAAKKKKTNINSISQNLSSFASSSTCKSTEC